MRKSKFLYGLAILAIAAVAAGNVNFNSQTNLMSDLTLANIEALANDGEANDGYHGTNASCTETVVVETYITNQSGYSWNASINAWFFQGSIAKTPPTSSEKRTSTTTSSWNGCKPQGQTNCFAPSC